MQRPGADPSNMLPSDFLCDFSGRAWDGAFPLVEGHQGSLICGDCLTQAYTLLVSEEKSAAPPTYTCTMCLEETDRPGWRGARDEALICLRCVKQAAGRLHKDPDWEWRKPENG